MTGYFKVAERGSSLGTEIRAGFVTYLTMAYITFVNPAILCHDDMPFRAVLTATCVSLSHIPLKK